MSNKLPSDAQIRDRLRSKLHLLIAQQPSLAADVVPGVLAEATAIVQEFRLAIERLEGEADENAYLSIRTGRELQSLRAILRILSCSPDDDEIASTEGED